MFYILEFKYAFYIPLEFWRYFKLKKQKCIIIEGFEVIKLTDTRVQVE